MPLIRRLWKVVSSSILGLVLIYTGFAIFTARMAIFPAWYRPATSSHELSGCSPYMVKVYVHCENPRQSLGLEYAEFKTESAAPISGWWIPVAKNMQARGTIVLVHGGGADRRAMLKHAAYLHEAGFHTLLIDCFNHGLSAGDGRGISFGLHESESIVEVAVWAKKHVPGALEKPLFVMGTSQGAFAALRAMSLSPVIRGVIAENPYFSAKRVLREFPALEWEPRFIKEGAFLLISAWLGESLGDLSVDEFAEKLAGRPVLLIHGLDDDIVNVRQSQDIYDVLKGPKEIWTVKGARHEYIWNVAGKEYEGRVLDWLSRFGG